MNFLCICEDVGDQINLGGAEIYAGRTGNFEVLDYISQETVEIEDNEDIDDLHIEVNSKSVEGD